MPFILRLRRLLLCDVAPLVSCVPSTSPSSPLTTSQPTSSDGPAAPTPLASRIASPFPAPVSSLISFASSVQLLLCRSSWQLQLLCLLAPAYAPARAVARRAGGPRTGDAGALFRLFWLLLPLGKGAVCWHATTQVVYISFY
jgi:hypothetical protein